MLFTTSQLFILSLLSPAVLAQADGFFRWDRLEPSTELAWTGCYRFYQCARLEVPLDYSNASVGTAALAIIRLPANVSKEEYKGPLLMNPGGPGGSGVDTLVEFGPGYTSIVGNQHDIVSFDPRGVSYSTPIISFFETDTERALWNAAYPSYSLNASSDALPQVWGRYQLLGQLAAQRDTDDIFKYMTTDNVARDMLLITQKFGFEKVSYYGYSYGSVLGTTFAAIFPDKVERIIVDGVEDANAYYQANLTIEVTATDRVLDSFFTGCAAAGPTLCDFYTPPGTPKAISDRLDVLMASIRDRPVPVITHTSYALVDYSFLRLTLFNTLYAPYVWFSTLAKGLAALEAGDGAPLYEILFPNYVPFECNCTTNEMDAVPFHLNGGLEAVITIRCADSLPVNDTLDELREMYEEQAHLSQFAEFVFSANRISCDGWKLYRPNRFLGPVAAANTSSPLLFISNTADPVTPKEGALNTLKGFPGSVLLTQDSPGHSSLTAPSLCTRDYIQQYLENGTLPEPGTVCPVDATLFGVNSTGTDAGTGTARRRALQSDEEEILAAWKAARGAFSRVNRQGLGR